MFQSLSIIVNVDLTYLSYIYPLYHLKITPLSGSVVGDYFVLMNISFIIELK